MTNLDELVRAAEAAFEQATTPAELENCKAVFLGKSGKLTELLKGLAKLSPEEKRTQGAGINIAKGQIEQALQDKRKAMQQAELQAQLRAESLDVSLPGRRQSMGALHPVSLTQQRIEQIFTTLGFDVADGPEIETDWFSFTSLNNPPNHPARSMQDTFYVDATTPDGIYYNLRPHTSPMQIRYARRHVNQYKKNSTEEFFSGDMPDIKVIAPGRTYRVDSDATHSPMFHQVEGLWIGKSVSFRDLKSVYLEFITTFFETSELKLRFRPSYFPFTEPSAEIDLMFEKGTLAGKWLEVSGSGQVHPDVVRNMGLDPEVYMGFAFGSGIDRLAMLRYGIGDLRLFFENDIRFLAQFKN